MARFLDASPRGLRKLLIILTLGSLGIGLIITGLTAFAFHWSGHYEGWFTAYAMGNRYGASGKEIGLTDFANHHPSYCPGDPAAWWPYGTQITTDTAIYLPWQDGSLHPYWNFYLYDVGDLSCSQGNYWVDIYHGRWKWASESCYCGGVFGFCYNGTTNSCYWANQFGRQWRGYWK